MDHGRRRELDCGGRGRNAGGAGEDGNSDARAARGAAAHILVHRSSSDSLANRHRIGT